ncbi:competence protein ComEA helix-hairpin-helix repeat protein [Paraglaciecola sp. T6c]|uniref:ComEA family DNA-binding protein n=1 Tax=Pseudoalteromonas atlantica (strain T6c / ATCC BAA-1087) TaxID=3042615 RepID=UPI00005C5A25|nr:helix-hairpin-helix domain-containing protein [Paraglaciecola sp. T6c]ABG41704.1 competence protein ComEA helix-hairpin-helix repeat protein [Paraglaciecola sp. T6c]
MKKFIATLFFAGVLLSGYVGNVVAEAKVDKSSVTQKKSQKINLNTATAEQLVTLPGIGKKKAAAIIAYRDKSGKFAKISDLTNVKGIGKKMVAKLAAHVQVN